jgi:hypothetical protein
VRHELIRRKALLIDHVIDMYKRDRSRRSFPHKAVSILVPLLFPGSTLSGRGWFKTVHRVSSRERELVLKTANRRSIHADQIAYRRIPSTIRHRYFGKIYWRTRYCLLQKYGSPGPVPPDRLQKLKAVARRYHLDDVKEANVRKINGTFKIVDANPIRRRR